MNINLTHHAYGVIGDKKEVVEIKELLEKKGIRQSANPDYFEYVYDTFAIGDARQIKSLHETRPINESGKKIFILSMSGITSEAQNALLKLLEEPSEYAIFFIVIPSAHLLLPTVRSRMQILERGKQESVDLGEAKKFLKLSPAKKMEEIKTLVDSISKEKLIKQDAIIFLNNIEKAAYEQGKTKENMKLFEAIGLVRTYINDRAPSIKMLLEYLALSQL